MSNLFLVGGEVGNLASGREVFLLHRCGWKPKFPPVTGKRERDARLGRKTTARSLTHLTISVDDILISRQSLKSHWTAGVEFLRANPDLGT